MNGGDERLASFTVLGSGSTGNAILLQGQGDLLLDCGFMPRALGRSIAAAGGRLEDLKGIVLSHEHSDHARGAVAVAESLRIPIYASAGTLRGLPSGAYESRTLTPGETVGAAGFSLTAFEVEHDAADPVGLRIVAGGRTLAYLTDTGQVTSSIVQGLTGCENLLVESNHDPDLLQNGPYPAALKRRIQGGRGHLSNDACGHLLQRVVTQRTERVVLHHLSRFNNTPELARATAHAILHRTGQVPPELVAAPARGPFGPFSF